MTWPHTYIVVVNFCGVTEEALWALQRVYLSTSRVVTLPRRSHLSRMLIFNMSLNESMRYKRVESGADASIKNSIFDYAAAHWLFTFNDNSINEAACLLSRAGADYKAANESSQCFPASVGMAILSLASKCPATVTGRQKS